MQKRRVFFVSLMVIVIALDFLIHVSCAPMETAVDEDIRILRGSGLETIYFADSTAFAPSWYENEKLQSTSILLAPFSATIAALDKVGIWNRIKPPSYMILGAKNFRSPQALGMFKSDQLCFIKLSGSSSMDFNKIFKAPAEQYLNALPVWKWQRLIDESGNPWNFYILQPDAQRLLVATSIELIKEGVTVSLSDKSNARGSEWGFVDLKQPIWAVRRYDHSATDRMAAGLDLGRYQVDTKAVALTFSFDPIESKAVIRLLTTGNDAGLLSFWGLRDGLSFRNLGSGVWETSYRLNNENAFAEKQGSLLFMLGFGANI